MHNKAKTYTVYVHENSTNGKVYIGITSQKPENRWRNGKGYLTGYANKTPFANAIMKYGWENFSHHIVLSDISQERANQIEQNLIRVFNSTDRSKGYNLSHGGGGVTGFTVDEVERKARSERMKGAKFSDERAGRCQRQRTVTFRGTAESIQALQKNKQQREENAVGM